MTYSVCQEVVSVPLLEGKRIVPNVLQIARAYFSNEHCKFINGYFNAIFGKMFYEHSALKLWLKILFPQGKKLSFQHFCTSWLKYNIVLKWQITFNLGLNVAKTTHPIKKKLWLEVVQNWISYKKVRKHIWLSSLLSGDRGCERLIRLEYYIVLKRRITFRRILACVCKCVASVKCHPTFQGEGGVCCQTFMR